MSFFDYLKRKMFGSRSDLFEDNGPLSLGGTLRSLAAEDAECFARGEVPEARLIPHHAIKRDVIIAAYTKDFDAALATALQQIKMLAWTEPEKQRRIEQMKADFEKHIYGAKRLSWTDLDAILALMKETRTDLPEIERDVRAKHPRYRIVASL